MKALLILLSVMFVAVGCGKKKQSNFNPYMSPYGYGNGTCASCPGGSQFMFSALGVKVSGNVPVMELGLEFFSATTAQPNNSYIEVPVSAQGTLYVNQPDYYCGVMPGQYQLTTVQPGILDDQSIYELKMTANGPMGAIPVELTSAFVSSSIPAKQSVDGRTYPYALENFIRVGTCTYRFEEKF